MDQTKAESKKEWTLLDKAGELDWFEFETRMRRLVVDLIQPTVFKLNKDREDVSILKSVVETNTKKVEDLENLILKSDRKQTKFEEIYNQISDSVP